MRLLALRRCCVPLRVRRRAVLMARRRGHLTAVRAYVFVVRSGKRVTSAKCGQANREQPSEGARSRPQLLPGLVAAANNNCNAS